MNRLTRLMFRIWYMGRPPWDTGVSPPELLDFIQAQPAGRAIDLGCGTGTNVITLARAGWQVTGVDFVPRAIRIAKQKAHTAGITADLRVGDVTNLQGIREHFDLALDIGCFHAVNDREAYLGQLLRILSPGGHWLMYAFLKADPHRPGPGLAAPDLDRIATRGLTQSWRRDGADRQARPSAWFLYQRNA